MEHNFERLQAHILPLSKAQTFSVARQEWVLVGVEISEEFDNCPCGKDIKEHCWIENKLTGHETYMGNVPRIDPALLSRVGQCCVEACRHIAY